MFFLCLHGWAFPLRNTEGIFKVWWTLCFILWMTELCWFYNTQSRMTTERYYVGFIHHKGLLNHPLHLSQKQQIAIESRQGCMKYNQAHFSSGGLWCYLNSFCWSEKQRQPDRDKTRSGYKECRQSGQMASRPLSNLSVVLSSGLRNKTKTKHEPWVISRCCFWAYHCWRTQFLMKSVSIRLNVLLLRMY